MLFVYHLLSDKLLVQEMSTVIIQYKLLLNNAFLALELFYFSMLDIGG